MQTVKLKKVMKENRIDRLIALMDYASALGIGSEFEKLTVVEMVSLQNQIEKIIQDAINVLDIAQIERLEQEDFDKRDIKA
jgi:hypothetical protein